MLTVILGLAGALVYGAADFLGGLAARRIDVLLATAISAVAGLAALAVFSVVVAGEWSIEAVVWGALSGLAGTVAVALLYACLAIGPMSILSPLTAVVSAIVPTTWGLLGGERLGVLAIAAVAVALVAVVLVGFVPEKGAVRPSVRGLAMAVGSGLMIGTFLILVDRSPVDSGLVPLLVNRVVSSIVMFAAFGVAVLLVRARSGSRRVAGVPARATAPSVRRAGLALAVSCGVLDATANAVILFGLRIGELSVMSVLVALYPAGTILLAAVVLRERVAPVQWIGLVLALTAAGILAVA
ncbi:EamA/RhaT family transporter [Labedella phragmitis]|uniref:EamA/RhaT family transporter n=1 Tax=Labedella phragmitis TaxID=2498849 RepID=A0A3S3ZPV2_9MICO|nr:EamA family transporter [Labedella phragmitis]RWZ50899.1 EamA/RhaT family transporter [Labedella phragmitis]